MERPFFERVAIVGVGLIGGSLALDMKRLGLTGHVMGVGRGVENLKIAEERGIVDRWTTELTHGVEGCGLVVVAVPVKSVAKVVGAMMPALEEGTIVTDVGSVKERIIEEVEPLLKEGVSFVPAHPIAGTEHSGAQAAFTGLFKDRKCILTPTPNTNPAALETVKRLWQEVGSQVVIMDAGMHDVILAGVSHLPHVIAYSLVNTISTMEAKKGQALLEFSAGGFRDFTRIASSSPEMWADICSMNRTAILDAIEEFLHTLNELKESMAADNTDKVREAFERAKKIRDAHITDE